MEEVTSNMTIAVMMMYLACHEVEWKCTNIKSYPIFCAYPIFCDPGVRQERRNGGPTWNNINSNQGYN